MHDNCAKWKICLINWCVLNVWKCTCHSIRYITLHILALYIEQEWGVKTRKYREKELTNLCYQYVFLSQRSGLGLAQSPPNHLLRLSAARLDRDRIPWQLWYHFPHQMMRKDHRRCFLHCFLINLTPSLTIKQVFRAEHRISDYVSAARSNDRWARPGHVTYIFASSTDGVFFSDVVSSK